MAEISADVSGYISVLSGRQPSMNKQIVSREIQSSVGQWNHSYACGWSADSKGVHRPKRTDVVISNLGEGDSARGCSEIKVCARPGGRGEHQNQNDESCS